MAEDFTVNYHINVDYKSAEAAITAFQQQTERLQGLSARFQTITQDIGRVNAAFKELSKSPTPIRVDTKAAISSLDNLLVKMKEVQGMIATSASGGTGNSSTRRSMHPWTKFFADINKRIGNLNSKEIKPKANVAPALEELQKLSEKLAEIRANSRITITATGGNGVTGESSSRTRRTTSSLRNYAAGASARSLLGPTYLDSGTNIIGSMVKGMGVAYGLSSLMSGMTNVVKESAAYDNLTQTTKNILATHDERESFDDRFYNMNKIMRQVGVETKFKATEVADAGKFLAMAGLDVDQISQSIKPIANMALIGDTDLGETADVVTNIMTSYQIPARGMNRAADMLTMTMTKSNTSLLQLAESFKYVGTVAHQSGVGFETTTSALGVLGDAGIQGSHAGTTLRMMLLNMLNPTKKAQGAWKALGISTKDSDGNMRGVADILKDLKEKRDQMSPGNFQTLINKMFRVTAVPGVLALISNVDKLEKVAKLNTEGSYGLAEKLADAKKNTIQGMWYQLTSAFTETGMKQFEGFQGVIKEFLQKVINLMKSPEFAEAMRSGLDMFIKLADGLVDIFRKLMAFWNKLPDFAKTGIVKFAKFQMVVSMIGGVFKTLLSMSGLFTTNWLSRFAVGMLSFFKMLKGVGRFMAGRGTYTLMRGMVSGGLIGSGGLLGGARGAGGRVIRGFSTGASSLATVARFLTLPATGWALGTVAAGAVAYYIYKEIQAIKEAKKVTEQWAESYRNLGIDKMQFASADDLVIGNMRIYNGELATQSDRLRVAGVMWHKYWESMQGPKDQHAIDTPLIELPEGRFMKLGEKIVEHTWGKEASLEAALAAVGAVRTQDYASTTAHNAYKFPGGQKVEWTDSMGESTYWLLRAGVYAMSNNNPWMKRLEKATVEAMSSVRHAKDAAAIVEQLTQGFMPKSESVNLSLSDGFDTEAAKTMSADEYLSIPLVNSIIKARVQEYINKNAGNLQRVLGSIEEGKSVRASELQNLLHTYLGIIADPKYGQVGTKSWVAKIRSIYDNPKTFGLGPLKQDEITANIVASMQNWISFYNQLDEKYRQALSGYADMSAFEAVLQGFPHDPLTPFNIPVANPRGNKIKGNSKGGIISPLRADGSEFLETGGTVGTQGIDQGLLKHLYNGYDQSEYRSHYSDQNAAPKQIIVKIENLMRIDKQTIDMTDDRQVAAINNIKQELATALLDVVQDFNNNMM